MTKPKTYAPDESRPCQKCHKWGSQEGSSGSGRQYRCGVCTLGRLMRKREPVLQEKRV